MSYILCTDTIIDTNEEFFIKNNIKPIEHGLVVDGAEIFDGFCKTLTEDQIYKMLREEKVISTVQGNINQMYEHFRAALSNGKDLLYICFSSALSGTYNTALMVARDVMSEYDGKIYVVDSKCAAAGQGILVRKAIEKMQNNVSIEDLVTFIELEREHIHHYAIIENLDHLKRGGRISKTSAFVGSLVGIKPLLHVTEEGSLIPFTKARGMNNAVKILITKINENIIDGEEIYISHCDNISLAEEMQKLILEQTNVKAVHINYLGNTIGCHLGPDALAVFFKGTKRA